MQDPAPHATPAATELLSFGDVRKMLGGISEMAIYRWQRDPRTAFPPPDYRISRRVFWQRATVEGWLETRRLASVPKPSTPGQHHPAAPPKSRAA